MLLNPNLLFLHLHSFMKKVIFFLLVFSVCATNLHAQTTAMPAIDKSPADISYYPANFPALKIQEKVTESLAARIIYSRPKKEDRAIFGGLVDYGKLWRLGANEATEIEFFQNVKINGKKVSKGRYTLYAIVYENTWTLIVNKETDTWGAFKYDLKKDVVRIDVPVQKTNESTESLAMAFEKATNGFNLVIAWEQVKVSMPVSF